MEPQRDPNALPDKGGAQREKKSVYEHFADAVRAFSGNLDHLDPKRVDLLAEQLEECMVELSTKRNWSDLVDLFKFLGSNYDTFGSDRIKKIMNVDVIDGVRPIHILCDTKCPAPILEEACRLGADVDAVAQTPWETGGDRTCTPLFLALSYGNFGAFSVLRQKGATVDQLGPTHVDVIKLELSRKLRSLVNDAQWDTVENVLDGLRKTVPVLGARAVSEIVSISDEDPAHTMLACSVNSGASEQVVRRLISLGATYKPAGKPAAFDERRFIVLEREKWRDVELTELLTRTASLARNSTKLSVEVERLQSYLSAFGRAQNEPQDVYCLAKAFADATSKDKLGSGLAFTKILPHLLFRYPPGAVTGLTGAIENLMDYQHDMRGSHPNEAEMLALLNHPQDPRREMLKDDINYHTRALTSITRFIEHRIPMTGRTLTNWGRIGALTFSFRNWRYDSITRTSRAADGNIKFAGASLLESYGFERIRARPTDKKQGPLGADVDFWGSGYMIRPGAKDFVYQVTDSDGVLDTRRFDRQTFVEFRRAYLRVYNPQHGELLIRNSSPEFGRDSMEHPAYVRSLPERQPEHRAVRSLLSLSPRDIEREFRPLIDIELNQPDRDTDSHLEFLLDELIGLKDDYRSWKCDTNPATAWMEPVIAGDSQLLLGGHLSRGFPEVVELIDHLHSTFQRGDRGAPPPNLAFVHPDYPPWSSYSFKRPDGKVEIQLEIDEDVLSALRGLVDGTITNRKWVDTGLKAFLQAGMDSRGELLLLAPQS